MEHTLTRDLRTSRRPSRRDYALFYLGLPILFALWLTGTGIRFVTFMSFGHGVIYMSVYCMVTWWGTDLGCRFARSLLHRWKPALWIVIVTGFLLIMLPLGVVYTKTADWLLVNYPDMSPFTSRVEFSWTLGYLLHFVRYSMPWLMFWLAVVYAYRFLLGVSWYGYEQNASTAATSAVPVHTDSGSDVNASVPRFLNDSSLPEEAHIYAIGAQEHYIRVWSDAGTDMIRYRFRDAVNEMADPGGMQVHRSWWIDCSRVLGHSSKGRSLMLALPEDLRVPVSLAHREKVLTALEKMTD